MSKRQHKPTSKAGEEFIKPHKPSHKEKILDGLGKLRIGGTYEEISLSAGMREDQVWKRMNELVKDGLVFDTGVTRKLKSGLHGIVWQSVEIKIMQNATPIQPQKPLRQSELFK